MKRGFAYLAVLLILGSLLLAAAFFTLTLTRWRKTADLDLARIQAQEMAESAALYYYEKQPLITWHTDKKIKVTSAALLELAGFDYVFADAGFRLVGVGDDIYFVGYAGHLPRPKAERVLSSKQGGETRPWYE
ncbi:hypothetical protein NO2_0264 [Candidatus Termititenax persephonae]|uniref:Uncharacterized protein n=1 Tax=Candidatus Termititenax persephonae TaxID=2218525 RepID=A0A388TF04_9BACT|nr:hypothetical protein NO2_0264 [Candidatus Termititenax persephonae]